MGVTSGDNQRGWWNPSPKTASQDTHNQHAAQQNGGAHDSQSSSFSVANGWICGWLGFNQELVRQKMGVLTDIKDW